jgi:hypothetical protein
MERQRVSRRDLLRAGIAVGALRNTGGETMANAEPSGLKANQTKIPDRPPRLENELVQEFVIAGHGNLEKVKQMLAEQPRLLNAAWDWGGGDWETALGGAAHTGSREIALYLLAQGARMDIFAAAMLGRLEIVRAIVEAFPPLAEAPGPHGIPLKAHAKAGGKQAEPVSAYLESLKPDRS